MSAPDPRFAGLPSVDQLLRSPEGTRLCERWGRGETTAAIRASLADLRRLLSCDEARADAGALMATVEQALERRARASLRPVFNLTGTVLHTNLGRALMAEAAIEAATAAMRHAVALEYDLETGKRGERDDHVRALLCDLTGAEDATLVNNNAAAVLLVLNTFAEGREAVVSRGELIEIGGAFRMPDIMARAGAILREVGTTNRTHARDYGEALGPATGLILKVHTSNYRIEGFTTAVAAMDLAGIARGAGVPLCNDLGSGTLVDLSTYGLQKEPTVRDAVAEGADLVTFSGDKLLGGPQAGFIVGRRDLVAALNRNPLKRALRVDKLRLAALEATLKLYRDPDRLAQTLPTLRLLARPVADIQAAAERLLEPMRRATRPDWRVECAPCRSQIGSGALPLETLPSAGLVLRPETGSGQALARLAAAFRTLPRPVIGRVKDGALMFDLRCLEDEAGFVENLGMLTLWEASRDVPA